MLTSCCALAVQLPPRCRMSKFIPFKDHHNSETSITFITNSAPSNTVYHEYRTHNTTVAHLSYFPDVVEAGDLGGQASMNAQELLVEQSGQGKAVKGLHAGIIHALRVLNLACNEKHNKKHPCISEQAQAEWMSFSSQGCHTVRLTYHSNAVWVRADRGLPTFQGLRNRWRRRMSHALLGDVAADPRANWDELRKAARREAD